MDRFLTSGGVASAPAVPSSPSVGLYPTSGSAGLGVPASVPGPYLYHMIIESLRNVIVGAGLTPDHADLTLLFQAIQALIAEGLDGIVTAKYTTAAQTYNWATTKLYTFTHELGVEPLSIMLVGKCLAADGGYSVGDMVVFPASNDDDVGGGADLGYSTKFTSTHVYLSFDTNHAMRFHEWNGLSRFVLADDKWEFSYRLTA